MGKGLAGLLSVVRVGALCFGATTSAALRAQTNVQDFDTWTTDATWTTRTNEAWVISNGRVAGAFHWHSPSTPPNAAWMNDYAASTSSWIRTPPLSNGVGQLSFCDAWYVYSTYTGGATNTLAIQTSPDASDWSTFTVITNTSSSWELNTFTLNIMQPLFIRLLKTGQATSGSVVYLGIDDVTLTLPPGVALEEPRLSPAAPMSRDDIDILVTLNAVHPAVTSVTLTAWYRFDGIGPYVSRTMDAVGGAEYRTRTPIPRGRAGPLEVYIEAAYTGGANGVVYSPGGGIASPAEFTIANAEGSSPAGRQLGPCTRRTGLTISEIMYHPAGAPDGAELEYVELRNTEPMSHDMSGYRLSGDIDYAFPEGTILPGLSALVVAKDPAALSEHAPVSYVLGPYSGSLPNAGGVLRLRNELDAILLDIEYSDQWPWPPQADGAGHSLVLARPDYGEGDVRAWAAGARFGGSAGYADTWPDDALAYVVVSEFLAHTDLPQTDFIEIANRGTQSVDVAGCVLTDEPSSRKFVVTGSTVLPPGGAAVFDQGTLGFSLSMAGDDIYLIDTNGERVIDAVRFGAQSNGVSSGRSPLADDELRVLAAPTPGSANSALIARNIVINEIMYHPIDDDGAGEYIELYNRGAFAVDLSYWRFTAGIDFTIPPGTTLAAGAYLVIAADAEALIARYPQLTAANTLGDFNGKLSDSGETLVLSRPDDPALPFQDYVAVDTVAYVDGGRWGEWSDGGGSSLELIDPHSDNRRASNWADSDESEKAPWTTIDVTGTLDNGNGNAAEALRELQVLLLGAGACVLDNVQIVKAGSNLVPNGTFNSGISGWAIRGNHHASQAWPNGYGGTTGLLVAADGDGDNGANGLETDLPSGLLNGDTDITIRCNARWLRGHRDLLLRVQGNYMEAAGTLDVPTALGSPGLVNSRYAPNVGPAVWNVAHAPVLPATGRPVTVTCRAQDPDGLATLTLSYRVDPATTRIEIPMKDDGTGGDAVPGDGAFAATIPGQAANTTVAFYIEATDADAAATRFPDDAPTRECLVMFGQTQPAGDFGTYRIWITEAVRQYWTSQPGDSNEPLDCTLVSGADRVIYNAGVRYRGSPFIRGTGNPESLYMSFAFKPPRDDRLLGAAAFNCDRLERDDTYQSERMAFWTARKMGLPFIYQRYIHFYINEFPKGTIYGDCHHPNSSYIESWYPDDSEGELFEIDDWFEFSDSMDIVNVNATVENFTTTGGMKKQARYRWNWQKKVDRASDDDFTHIFQLVDTMNLTPGDTYEKRVEATLDPEQWMRTFSIRHACGDWDGYSYDRGKNTFTFRPVDGRWNMLLWDLDFSLGSSSRDPYSSLFSINDPILRNSFFQYPRFVRAYWRALADIVNGPFLAANSDPVMDENYAALVTNGVSVTAPTSIRSWMQARRTYIAGQLVSRTNVTFTVSTPDGPVSDHVATIAGNAPVSVTDIAIDGSPYPVRWTGETAWEADVAVAPGAHTFAVEGLNRNGASVGTDTVTLTGTAAAADPTGLLVINEIMYNASHPYGDFLELHNLSPTETFSLEGFVLNGADFTFGPGTFIAPDGYVVVAENRAGYQDAYGNAEVVVGEYAGSLDNGGETISLLMPTGSNAWTVLDEVRYDDDPPWPAAADGEGASLQLIDPTRDNNRIGNWAVASREWVFVSVSGTTDADTSQATVHFFLNAAGTAVLDDVRLVMGTDPLAGTSVLLNGDFETALTGPWIPTQGHAGSLITNAPVHGGSGSLAVIATEAGNAGSRFPASVAQSCPGLSGSTTYTLSFWHYPSDESVNLTATLTGSTLSKTLDTLFVPEEQQACTPGEPNNVSGALPPFPLVRINEIMPINTGFLTNNLGQYAPWIELYNSGTDTVDLSENLFLSDSPDNLLRWPFPAGLTIGADQRLLVWADGQPGATAPGAPHTDFALSSTGGCVVLSRDYGGRPIVLDALCYALVGTNTSYGAYPEGTPYAYSIFHTPTPGSENTLSTAYGNVAINEWMADNATALHDPADYDAEDWFELYNRCAFPVDLGGYQLTDSLSATNRDIIPGGTVIGAHGFMLVWADGETGQNGPGRDLHVSFKLSKDGEAIALYAPDGTLLDAVVFGAQTTDVSQGRWPDGESAFYPMHPPTPDAPNAIFIITGIAGDGNAPVALSWHAEPGAIYQLEYRTALDAPPWLPLGTITAQLDTVTISDTNAADHAFYRIRRVGFAH